jgi:hypothetical protein
MMRKFLVLMFTAALSATTGWAQTGNRISLTGDGWTVTADGTRGSFSIMHDRLGSVLKDARLNLQGANGLHALSNWSAEKKGENALFIRTEELARSSHQYFRADP